MNLLAHLGFCSRDINHIATNIVRVTDRCEILHC